jgi:hypothetical protein
VLRWGWRLIDPLRAVMPGWLRAPPASLPPSVRRGLTTDYATDIQMLEGLIQRDVGHWLIASTAESQ